MTRSHFWVLYIRIYLRTLSEKNEFPQVLSVFLEGDSESVKGHLALRDLHLSVDEPAVLLPEGHMLIKPGCRLVQDVLQELEGLDTTEEDEGGYAADIVILLRGVEVLSNHAIGGPAGGTANGLVTLVPDSMAPPGRDEDNISSLQLGGIVRAILHGGEELLVKLIWVSDSKGCSGVAGHKQGRGVVEVIGVNKVPLLAAVDHVEKVPGGSIVEGRASSLPATEELAEAALLLDVWLQPLCLNVLDDLWVLVADHL